MRCDFFVFALLAVCTLVFGMLAAFTSIDNVSGTGFYSTYRYNLVFFFGPRAVRDDASFRAAQFETCPRGEAAARATALITQSWDSGSFSAAPVLQDRVFVNAWNFLPLIFTVSATCEMLRTHAPPGEEHGRKIRFLRWVEYALTSPFMLVIIALAGFQRDRTVLILLATGQFALIFFGHTLELELEIARTEGTGLARFVTVFLASWCVHGVLWLAVILPLSIRTIEHALPCTGWTSSTFETFKVLFIGLVYSEFVLFSLFGAALPLAMAGQTGWRVWSGIQDLDLKKVWADQDWYYAGLNVSAKTVLFGLITGIVFQMPPEVRFADPA